MNVPTLATRAELAHICDVTDRTIRNWIDAGKLEPAGTWTPENGRTITLFAVDEARAVK